MFLDSNAIDLVLADALAVPVVPPLALGWAARKVDRSAMTLRSMCRCGACGWAEQAQLTKPDVQPAQNRRISTRASGALVWRVASSQRKVRGR